MNKLSVVIPALNEETLIGKTLESLNEQSRNDFSVMVVDNGSSDNTKNIVSNFTNKSKYSLALIEEKNKGVGYARNTGSLKAIELGFIYLAGTDADTILPKDWIESIYSGFEKSDATLLCGECDPLKNITFNNSKIEFTLKARSALFKKIKPYFRGANYAITSDLFTKSGGIHQPLTNNGKPAPGEDGRLEIDALSHGGKISACLSTVYPHPRRYISNLQKISEFNGSVHEGGVVTEVRNEASLEKSISQIPQKAIDIFVDKIKFSFFNEYVLNIYKEPILKEKYWEKSIEILKPFSKEEIELDLSNYTDVNRIWSKYQDTFTHNVNSLLKTESVS